MSKVWLQSWLGKRVDLLEPNPNDIDYRDIAHHLAIENRYTGATYRPYSVAQHSILVAKFAGGWDGANYTRLPEARFGLLHDATEAYLKDIHGPLKNTPIFDAYRALEEKWMVVILTKFGMAASGEFTDAVEDAVKHADRVMLYTEKRDLLGPPPEPWGNEIEPDRAPVDPWSWRTAECNWRTEFEKLFPAYKI